MLAGMGMQIANGGMCLRSVQACPLHAAVSIVETQRQYLKSTHGTGRACIPRSMSFCQFAFLPRLPVVLVVEDTLEDERCFSIA